MRIFIYKCDRCNAVRTDVLMAGFKIPKGFNTVEHLDLCDDCIHCLLYPQTQKATENSFNLNGTVKMPSYPA